jgi:hypothetical protein
MSMAKLARLGVARELQDSPEPDHQPGAEVKNDSYADRLAAFIPSEVVAIYIAMIGLFPSESSTVRWSLFAVGLVLVPLFSWLNFTARRRRIDPPLPARPRVFIPLVLLAAVAYVGWAAALPSTPFLDFTDEATRIGAAAVLILSFVLPRVADLLGLTPDSGADQPSPAHH